MIQRWFRTFVLCFLFVITLLPASAAGGGQALQPRAVPANDMFENRQSMTWNLSYFGIDLAQATTQPNEPAHQCRTGGAAPGSNSVWYRFVVEDGFISMSTIGSNGSASNTLLSLWQGSDIQSLTFVACDDDSGGSFRSALAMPVTAGEYVVQVSRWDMTPADAPGGLQIGLNFTSPGNTPPSNDAPDNAIALQVPDAYFIEGLNLASASMIDPVNDCMGSVRPPRSVWFTVTNTSGAAQPVTISTVGGTIDTTLGLYIYNFTFNIYAPIDCSNDHGGATSAITETLSPGLTYYIVVATSPADGSIGGADVTLKVSHELVENGGFESGMTGWKTLNATSDKRKCNKENKPVTVYGLCAFAFTGGPGESSNLVQKIFLPPGYSTGLNDIVTINYLSSGSSATRSKLILTKKYASADPVKCKLTQTNPIPKQWHANHAECGSPANVTSIKLQLRNSSPSGKLTVDDVSVAIEEFAAGSRGATPLPAPGAPLSMGGNS